MLSIINGKGHPKKITTETTTNIGDGFVALRNTTVPAKFRLASAIIMVATIAMIIARAMNNEVTTDMHQVLAGKLIDLGIQIDSEGRRQLGHLQKDCRMFQALRRVTENTQAEAVNRGYAKDLGARCMCHCCHHHQQLPMETNVVFKIWVLQTPTGSSHGKIVKQVAKADYSAGKHGSAGTSANC
jgi:hypothetical protein